MKKYSGKGYFIASALLFLCLIVYAWVLYFVPVPEEWVIFFISLTCCVLFIDTILLAMGVWHSLGEDEEYIVCAKCNKIVLKRTTHRMCIDSKITTGRYVDYWCEDCYAHYKKIKNEKNEKDDTNA